MVAFVSARSGASISSIPAEERSVYRQTLAWHRCLEEAVPFTQMNNCVWCSEELSEVTKDHVFPRGLGGKLEEGLWIPSCTECQKRISQAETEILRRSIFGTHRLAKDLKPRNPRRPTSGLIDPKISLVKNPHTTRYAVVSFKLGQPHPKTLPALEMDPKSGEGFIHGEKAEDANRLIRSIKEEFSKKPRENGLVFAMSTHPLEGLAQEIIDDPHFHPRVYLSPRDRLEVCARNPDEALALMRCVVALEAAGELRERDPGQWQTFEMPAKTPHKVAFVYEQVALGRVLLKIAYGIATARLAKDGEKPLDMPNVTRAVIGIDAPGPDMVQALEANTEELARWMDHLVCVVAPVDEHLLGLVGLYSSWFLVDLGPIKGAPQLSEPFGAACKVVQEREQRWFSKQEAEELFAIYRSGVLRVKKILTRDGLPN